MASLNPAMNNLKQPEMPVDPLAQLKSILLTEDQQRIAELEAALAELKAQLSHKAQLIATLEPVIGEVLEKKIGDSKDEMARSLAPVMGAAIKRQIKDAREDVIDALYPIVGRMVAKAVAEAMKKIIANINANLNRTFKFSRWFRQQKARLQGIDPAEKVLADAFPFQLQRVFLIARDSGLLISYAGASQSGPEHDEAHIIGGMLTAIKSFMETSFAGSREGDLNEIEHSEFTIRINSGRYTYLAAVFSGVAGNELDEELRNLHIRIHERFHRQLRSYDGDNSRLQGIEQPLREIIRTTQHIDHEHTAAS